MNNFFFSLFSISFFLIPSISNAQEFAPLGSNWHFQYWSLNNDQYVDFYSANALRDTTIDNRYVTILSLVRENILVNEANIFINEQNNQVFFFEDDTFKLLFDFNLTAGDTLTFSVPQNHQYYDITCGNQIDDSDLQLARVKVDSIIQGNFDGQFLNMFYTSPIYPETTEFFSWDLGIVIERIGSTSGIFGFSITQCLGGDIGHFRCYNDSLIFIQNSIEECDYVLTSKNALNSKSDLLIFPNPTSNYLFINLPFHEQLIVEIYNQLGQLQFSKAINPSKSDATSLIEFDLENGIYFTYLKSADYNAVRKFQVIK
jgi:hypothetical protein